MAKTPKTDDTEFEYISKEETRLYRKPKTVTVEQSCLALISEHGTVSVDLLVAEAQDADHPLHQHFEWDDTVAGRKWRRAQALAMIIATRYVVYLKDKDAAKKAKPAIQVARESVQVRRFLPAGDGSGFRDRASALSDDECRKAIVEKKIGALRSWCKSVVDIQELAAVRTAVAAAVGE